MVSGHVSSGHYILFQRDPRLGDSAPLLEVGRLLVLEVDADTRIEHWFLYTSAPIGSGYAKYIRPSSALAATSVGLWFRGVGAAPSTFDPNTYEARLNLSTGCGIEYIMATCDRLSGTSLRVTTSSASAAKFTANQVDLGIYDITQGNRRVGVLSVTPNSGGTLEQWVLFEKGSATNEGPYAAPDPSIGGAYALTYLGSSVAPDLTGRAVVTVNAVCATAA